MKPHKCPVCNGEGIKNTGYGFQATTKEECHACKGSGIVWEMGNDLRNTDTFKIKYIDGQEMTSVKLKNGMWN